MTAAREQSGALRHVWARTVPGAGLTDYLDMIDALRTLEEQVAVARPPAGLVADVTRAARDLAARLGEHAVPEVDRICGRIEEPGRGQMLVPSYLLHDAGDGRVRGTTRFGQRHLGSNAAVHGGVIPLMFDEILGHLAGSGGRTPARTAYLHVDYRNVTPLDTELGVEAWFASEEGRKRLMRGTLHHGDTLCAEVEALFVALRPGQP